MLVHNDLTAQEIAAEKRQTPASVLTTEDLRATLQPVAHEDVKPAPRVKRVRVPAKIVNAKMRELQQTEADKKAREQREQKAALRATAEALAVKDMAEQERKRKATVAAEIEERMKIMAPRVEIVYAGKLYCFEIGSPDQVTRGTAIEGARRCAMTMANLHRDRVERSKVTGEIEAAKDVTDLLVNSSAELEPAIKLDVLSVRSDL